MRRKKTGSMRFLHAIISEVKSLTTYRARLDIIAEILGLVSQNFKKTQIMYQANLNYKVLQKYLHVINEASLITYQCDKQLYVISDKGNNFLEAYKSYKKCNSRIEKMLREKSACQEVLENLCTAE